MALEEPQNRSAIEKPLAALLSDMARLGIALSDADWVGLAPQFDVVQFAPDEVIDRQTEIAERWFFVTQGIAASRQTHLDGQISIARFFEKGQVCANLTSAWTQQYAADDLIALTELAAVAIPDTLFRNEFLGGGELGRYLRLKAMETLCFDKEVLSAKSRVDTEIRYQFLERYHEAVLDRVRQRDIAAFLGITPQGFSRFKRKRRAELNPS